MGGFVSDRKADGGGGGSGGGGWIPRGFTVLFLRYEEEEELYGRGGGVLCYVIVGVCRIGIGITCL